MRMSLLDQEPQKNNGINIRKDTGKEEYGFLIRVVMQLPGGYIDTIEKAYYTLAAAGILFAILAAIIFYF